ncbi:cryptochrome/photolyase family protein [Lyticum sinuosum]|uniref:Deoxyribodipyrimidine photo-lyase n=1 Tax=Lyticum sinuosum TaxID=1332059 RepID=A0AAE4VJA8_9RICK|nr:deoxyribodipyrimidine photo-lyase [Lyticum sinuosum]MDZ5761065.1 Deoxyribodipyrimidine photo-lyase [Lyticum sinuosum]
MINILLFTCNLRLSDNHTLNEASKSNLPILSLYIYDFAMYYPNFFIGEASRWWLYNSLFSLNSDDQLNGKLNFFSGHYDIIIEKIIQKYQINGLYWQKDYSELDNKLISIAKKNNIRSNPCIGKLLWEPNNIMNKNNEFYKIFTPYKTQCLKFIPNKPITKPDFIMIRDNQTLSLDDLDILPKNNWHKKFDKIWKVGEKSAQIKLNNFINLYILQNSSILNNLSIKKDINKINNIKTEKNIKKLFDKIIYNNIYEDNILGYKTLREYPGIPGTSYLSPHIHFGEISPHQIWWEIQNKISHANQNNIIHYNCFLNEIIWREFSYYLIYHFPNLYNKNFNAKFDFWVDNYDKVKENAWKYGTTGYPIIDAGMRQLWNTGYMHNRVRMIVSSFLVKNLFIDWRYGAEWFIDCLVDADIAVNSNNWQWVAGCGADAAPYFRIFNPILQSKKFDPYGQYIKKYIPELKNVSIEFIHEPWKEYNSSSNYPSQIINIDETRKIALSKYKLLKNIN